MRKRVFFIVNPFAGTLKIRTAMFDVLNKLSLGGCDTTVRVTEYRGHAEEMAEKASVVGYDIIACCGGDGTLNEVINGVLKSGKNTPVGYIPAGSTNDFAASMGIPTNPKEAAKVIVEGIPRSIDVGRWCGQRYFSYIASFGAFTAASYSAPQPTKNVLGHLAYILEGIKDLQNIRALNLAYTVDGKRTEGEYIFGAVSNSTSVGGIVKLSSDMVSFDDGLFEILLVRMPKSLAEMNIMIQAILAADFNSRMFDFFRADSVEFDMFENYIWSLDGERAEAERIVKVENIHAALPILHM